MNREINSSFMHIVKRAEANELARLVETFVDVGPLFTILGATDHQVLYGRRGTGKTHALLYLGETRTVHRDIPVYIDMRTIGSTGGIYSDESIPLNERATRLLMDTLGAIHERLLDFVTKPANRMHLGILGPLLDDFGREITTVMVVGTETRERVDTARSQNASTLGVMATLATNELNLGVSNSESRRQEQEHQTKVAQSGTARHRVHFGGVGQVLSRIIENLEGRRIWVLLDEWSVVPNDVQPLLADLLRRSLLPLRGITLKIGAIEQRTTLQIAGQRGDYTGIELGADVAADVNLDDFIVFENDAIRAIEFFQELIYRHYKSAAEDLGFDVISTPSELIRLAFTQRNVFDEFVRAAEGVPRDAIYILGIASQRAFDEPISIFHIRAAAKTWYQRDKEAPVTANPHARDFLHWIIEEVIAHRRARAFLLRSNTRHPLIDSLFDARVLHLLKRNIAAHDQPGVRYDVYKIDYGCYVDLLTTLKAPQGLLPSGDDGGEYVEVPPDDYRAIRRAILDPSLFQPSDGAANVLDSPNI